MRYFIKGNQIVLCLDDCGQTPIVEMENTSKNSQLGKLPLHRLKQNDKNNLILTIVLKDSYIPIGRVSLEGIDWMNRSAELKIFVWEGQKRGIGYEACSLIIKHGFEQFGLNRIECGTFVSNEGMRKLALKLGFKEEGIRRNKIWKNNDFNDVIEYGILKESYIGG